jgi:cytoplasmic iron level regulating protein YaaA (DUF328/UPF0246 family)
LNSIKELSKKIQIYLEILYAITIYLNFFISFIYIESKRLDKTKEIINIVKKSNKFFNEEINKLIKSDLNKANELLLNLKSSTFNSFK